MSDVFELIRQCRLCGGSDLEPVLDLGIQKLAGVFPKSFEENEALPSGPLMLLRCEDPACGLVQLSATYQLDLQFGANYGYRSGLNAGMVRHLAETAARLQQRRPVGNTDVVLDIGSNDGTLLSKFEKAPKGPTLVGMDPTISKFLEFYRDDIHTIADFFTADRYRAWFGPRKASIVTSIAMLYDLPDPQGFADDVSSILTSDGIWHFEQSYVGLMLQRNAYDTVCHEHLEYYGLRQIHRLLSRAGLKILSVDFNDVNGGSFAVTAGFGYEDPLIPKLLEMERIFLDESAWSRFRGRVEAHREKLPARIEKIGGRVYGLGASTKGNTLLQWCGTGAETIRGIGEVNPDKFGSFTPGTMIPILPEADVLREADTLLILPWHFRAGFESMGLPQRLLFPLPEIEAVRREK